MTDKSKSQAAKGIGENQATDESNGSNVYRNEVVMEAGGSIDPNSTDYIESDDEINTIAEGYK